MRTYYPQSALEGFGRAIGHKLGVTVDFAAGKACTNGTTIWLPPITKPLQQHEFESMCGTVIHEAAHVYFDSVPRHKSFIGSGPDQKLRAVCFNAVIDVADETRIERVIPNAKHLLLRGNEEAVWDIHKNNAFDLANGADPAWVALVQGILRVRLGNEKALRIRGCKIWLKRFALRNPNAKLYDAIVTILKRCRNGRGFGSDTACRRSRDWSNLRQHAEDLVTLLKAAGMDGSGAPDTFGQAAGRPSATPGTNMIGAGAVMADAQSGEDIAKHDPAAAPKAPATPSSGKGAGSGNTPDMHDPFYFNDALYNELKPSLTGPIERLARVDEADGFTGGYLSGGRLGRNIESAMIDGRVFERAVSEGEKLHVTVLLDSSGSMGSVMGASAAIAQAFADAVRPIATSVNLGAFSHFFTAMSDYRDTTKLPAGGTRMGDAIRWSNNTLSGEAGRKVCVVITDGATGQPTECAALANEAADAGIRIIAIAFQTSGSSIAGSLPRAEIIEADCPMMLSLRLLEIASRIGAGAA